MSGQKVKSNIPGKRTCTAKEMKTNGQKQEMEMGFTPIRAKRKPSPTPEQKKTRLQVAK